jgi:hypothetical protein
MQPTKFFSLTGLDWDHVSCEPDTSTSLYREFSINPEEFLEFAKNDLEQGGRRGLVNALSNCKRAIDCQVDKVLQCLGIPGKGKNVPAKIATLADLGVVAPRILHKINRARNYLEHEFKCPAKEKVEDAVEVAELFLTASDSILILFQDTFSIGNCDNHFTKDGFLCHCIYVQFNPAERQFNVRGFRASKRIGPLTISSKDQLFIPLLRVAIAFRMSQGALDRAVKAFGKLTLRQAASPTRRMTTPKILEEIRA